MIRKAVSLLESKIVIGLIICLGSIAIPNMINTINRAKANSCISNLRMIEKAKTMYALLSGAGDNAAVNIENLYPQYLKNRPLCPMKGKYSIYTAEIITEMPHCSFHSTVANGLPASTLGNLSDTRDRGNRV